MTKQEILTKAIQKAMDNGFDGKPLWAVDFTAQGASKALLQYSNPHVNSVIYSHDFAKAIWPGDNSEYVKAWNQSAKSHLDMPVLNPLDYYPDWQYHLQQMVISEDPIKYLEENI